MLLSNVVMSHQLFHILVAFWKNRWYLGIFLQRGVNKSTSHSDQPVRVDERIMFGHWRDFCLPILVHAALRQIFQKWKMGSGGLDLGSTNDEWN